MHDLHTLTLDAPAASFYDALLLGNGRLGAAVHGLPARERVELNLDTFWSGGPLMGHSSAEQPAKQWLTPLRQAVRDRDHQRADQLAGHLQGTGWTQSYQPVGALHFGFETLDDPDSAGALMQYSRSLDMADAVATTTYTRGDEQLRVTAFVSAVRNVLVIHVPGAVGADDAAPAEALVGLGIAFETPHPHGEHAWPLQSSGLEQPALLRTWSGRAPTNVLPDYFGEVPDAVTYDADGPDQHGLVHAGMGFAVAALVQRVSGGVRLVLAAVDGFRGRDQRPSADLLELRVRAARLVEQAALISTEVLVQEHVVEHRNWFDRMRLELSEAKGHPVSALAVADSTSQDPAPPAAAKPRTASTAEPHASAEDAARFFHLGRYLLIASSRPGSQAANLQGIWNTDVRPGWSCNWTTNINLQMNYWPAEPAGLGELAEPFYQLVEDLSHTSRPTARAFYDADGWVVHHNTDLWGFSAPVEGRDPVNPACTNWPAGAWGLAAHYSAASGYPRFAKGSPRSAEKADSVVLGAAQLALALLEEHHDGQLVTNPSTSPEHLFWAQGGLRAVSAGSAMDQELVAEVLQNAIDLIEGRDHQDTPDTSHLAPQARDALRRLRPPQIGASGDLLEWADERPVQDRGHRHVSHLYGLFPGSSIDEVRTPELFAAARAALADRLEHGGGGTGWSQAWVLCLAARLGDKELVQRSLDILIHQLTSKALLDLHPVPNHPSGYRFQIDGNLGAAAGVLEALVQANADALQLLPALPHRWAAGSVEGVCASTGHVVDLQWTHGRLDRAQLTAARAGSTSVSFPADGDLAVTELSVSEDSRVLQSLPSSVRAGVQGLRWVAAPGSRLLVQRRLR